jgi:Tfp pilus assembly protein PilX
MSTPVPHRTHPAGDSGSALLIAVMVMSLILVLGLAMLSITDTQTEQSGVERVRESAFNLADGALQQQSFVLSGKGWPRTAAAAPPAQCDQSSSSRSCPSPGALVPATGRGLFSDPDYAHGTTWTTTVRDNVGVGGQTYGPAVDANPTWDANGDGHVWVKATAKVGGRARTVVALLRRDAIPLMLPKAVLVAGALDVGQNGQSPVITTDATTPPVLRCAGYGAGCAEYIRSGGKKSPQIAPDAVSYAPPGFPDRLIGADTVAKLIDTATTYTRCPTEQEAQGIVVVDVPDTTTCRFTGNGTFNSPSTPGVLIMRRGSLEFAGGGQFHGLLLHLNDGARVAPGAQDCISLTGTVDVHGGVIIEGRCGFYIQGNARLVFAPNAQNVSITGVAGIVQNTWRELTS